MHRAARTFAALLGACSALIAAGCGSSSTIVRISGAPDASITTAMLNHWMQATLGGEFRESIGEEGPRGLVAEPADYPRCINAAKLVAPRSFFNQLRLSRVQLNRICHELHRSAQAQALSLLIAMRWATVEGSERHIAVTDGEAKQAFERARRQLYPSERSLHDYLAERQWSLSDLLDQLKDHILASRLSSRSERSATDLGEQGTATLAGGNRARLLARTTCAPGYLVPNCSGYRGPPIVLPAPDAILAHLVRKDVGAVPHDSNRETIAPNT